MTTFLDLDAVAPAVEFGIKLNGKSHTLEEASVDTFLVNMRALEGLKIGASAADEMEVTIGIILRSFPTVTEEELRKLKLSQLQAISDHARRANGEIVEKEGSVAGNGQGAN